MSQFPPEENLIGKLEREFCRRRCRFLKGRKRRRRSAESIQVDVATEEFVLMAASIKYVDIREGEGVMEKLMKYGRS